MATAAPHVKLLRQLASAKDDYLSGAFDISWDGAKATLYLVFGRPSHAVFDTDQAQIEGEAAIDALLAELPRTFVVSDWRRAMSPQETLSISIDELAGPFVRLAGSYADDPVAAETPQWWSAEDSSPDLPFGLADFPLLPGGRPLWAETSPENVNLAERLAELPPSILILTGAKLRAAAVVSGGDLIDAVWIDADDQARGEAAAMAILGATKGSLAGYALDDPRVAEALTMLWRLPVAVSGIEMAWLDPASMLAAFRADGLDRVLIIDAPLRGIALFSRGGLVAVYSETQRSAVASPERLRSLLSQARGRLTVLERKPRPVAADGAGARTTAADFFAVARSEVASAEPAEALIEDGVVTAEPVGDPVDVAAEHTEPSAEGSDGDAEPATLTAEEGVGAPDPVEAPAEDATVGAEPVGAMAEEGPGSAESVEATAEERATVPDPINTPWYRPFAARAGARIAAAAGEPADGLESHAILAEDAAGSAVEEVAAAPTLEEDAAAPAEDSDDQAPAAAETVPDTSETQVPTLQTDDVVSVTEPAELTEPAVDVDQSDPPPPPPPHTDLAIDPADTPPPPPPEAPAEPGGKSKRGWRIFGGSRKRRAAARASEDAVTAPEVIAAQSAAQNEPEAASASGWSVREPGTAAQPVWSRPTAPDDTITPDEPAPVAAGDTTTPEYTWSVVDRSASAHPEPESPPPLATEIASLDAAAAPQPATPEATDAAIVDTPAPTAAPVVPAGGADGGLHDRSIVFEAAGESPGSTVPEAPREQPRDFWAEFATPDLDADDETAPVEQPADGPEEHHDPEPSNAEGPVDVATAAAPATVDEGTHGVDAEPHAADAPAPEAEAADSDDQALDHRAADSSRLEPATRPPSGRTVAPWSWPLAEVEVPVAAGPSGIVAASPLEDVPVAAAGALPVDLESHEPDHALGSAADQGFFQRDEPVGSQFVDFDEVRNELIQIGVVWLGDSSAAPVTALLLRTRSTIDDFVGTIDTIRGLHIEGQDPASVQAMAREMHQQAAERLSGA